MYILVCDDDAAFGANVAEYVSDYFQSREIKTAVTVCTNGCQALETPDLEKYQVAFLDGDMPQMNGIALGRKLKLRNPKMLLIYLSAYLEFAPQGYTVNAYRYILKRDVTQLLPGCLEDVLLALTDSSRTLTVRLNRERREIPLDQIYYLESSLRQINVYGDVPNEPICTYYAKMTELPQMLFENGFLQVGRSDVVNMKYIRRIRNYKVELRNGVELSMTRTNFAEIRSRYLDWKGQFGDA